MNWMPQTGNPYLRGRIRTAYLLVHTNGDQLLPVFVFYKITYPNKEVKHTELSPLVRVPSDIFCKDTTGQILSSSNK
jgi:hypothetical protein